MIPVLVGEGEGRGKGSQYHCEVDGSSTPQGNSGEHCGTSDSKLSHLRATGIRDYLPTPLLVICGELPAGAGCYFWNFQLSAPNWSGLQLLEPTGQLELGHVVVYKRIQITYAFCGLPSCLIPGPMKTSLFE